MSAAGIVDESGSAATGVMKNTSSEVSTILNAYKDTIALQQAVEEWFAIRACIVILGDSTAKDEANHREIHIPKPAPATYWMSVTYKNSAPDLAGVATTAVLEPPLLEPQMS